MQKSGKFRSAPLNFPLPYAHGPHPAEKKAESGNAAFLAFSKQAIKSCSAAFLKVI
jgi:hypothetical protein